MGDFTFFGHKFQLCAVIVINPQAQHAAAVLDQHQPIHESIIQTLWVEVAWAWFGTFRDFH